MKALATATRARLEHLGVGVIGSLPEELKAHLAAEMATWSVIIAEAGIKLKLSRSARPRKTSKCLSRLDSRPFWTGGN